MWENAEAFGALVIFAEVGCVLLVLLLVLVLVHAVYMPCSQLPMGNNPNGCEMVHAGPQPCRLQFGSRRVLLCLLCRACMVCSVFGHRADLPLLLSSSRRLARPHAARPPSPVLPAVPLQHRYYGNSEPFGEEVAL